VGSGSLQKTDSQTQIYLSGIGKGHGVDRVAHALAGLGLTDFMVEIGGDLYSSGRNPDGRPWQIGIEWPDVALSGVERVAKVSNLGMATSGDYRNYFEEDGVRYSHILDAKTGRPVTHKTASATVLAENAMLSDAWATAMLGLGRERGLEIAEEEDLAVLFIERDQKSFKATPSTRFYALQS
jgi:thiamine biosynthesis lipoprotein